MAMEITANKNICPQVFLLLLMIQPEGDGFFMSLYLNHPIHLYWLY